ncbi:unnamed protein product [Linum tenue]|uniref:Uncharacterized protein n=1 Tax=Linum tenue TaxID=586396 RepID=A0AAV0RKW8_9ROSI|nr:unnamed protein product [Linum tenue]
MTEGYAAGCGLGLHKAPDRDPDPDPDPLLCSRWPAVPFLASVGQEQQRRTHHSASNRSFTMVYVAKISTPEEETKKEKRYMKTSVPEVARTWFCPTCEPPSVKEKTMMSYEENAKHREEQHLKRYR